MNNYSIADNFSLLAKLMDIHQENSFKAKSYSIAAYTVEKLTVELSTIDQNKIFSLKGIGESVGHKIVEQLQTGSLKILEDYIAKTPQGVLEMLHIKGIGPKKIATIWHEMGIENLGELLYACNENRLTLFKGFGEKTQQGVKEAIEFYMGTQGSYLYQQIENYAFAIDEKLNLIFPDSIHALTSTFRRQLEIIEKLEWVTTADISEIKSFFITNDFKIVTEENGYISFVGKENVTLGFYSIEETFFYNQLFVTSCSDEFLQSWINNTGWDITQPYQSEEEIFEASNCAFIPICLR